MRVDYPIQNPLQCYRSVLSLPTVGVLLLVIYVEERERGAIHITTAQGCQRPAFFTLLTVVGLPNLSI